jgi:MATE family multidrug resistance protein
VSYIHTPFKFYIGKKMKTEIKAIILLSLPIIANGFLESSYGFMNTFLVAHLGDAELAVNALVSMLFVTLMVIFWGIISGVSIVISHYHGANNQDAIRGVMRDSLIFSIIICIPIMLLLWFAPYIFHWTGQSDFVVEESRKYLHALLWAIPSDLPGFALMQLFLGISKPRINFIFTLAYIPFLIFINYCFMFGKLGLPVMGLAGIGWGTTVAYTLYLIAMLSFIYLRPTYRHYFNFKHLPSKNYYGEVLRIGLPLGGMYTVEIAFFLVLAIFMGKFGNMALAAHQIVIQYFWLFMNVVFCIGQALSIRAGWRLGRNEPEWIMPLAKIGQMLVVTYTLFIVLIYWLFPHTLIDIDFGHSHDSERPLISMITYLFIFAGIFQIFDSIRLTFFSILRGLKDTNFTMITSIITFWGIALPVGYYLAFIHSKNPAGLWIGLSMGGAVGSLLLWWRLKKVYTIKFIKSK